MGAGQVDAAPERIRAFVGLRMSAEIDDAIAAFIGEICSSGDGVRWTPRGNLHLTLKFLGPAIDLARLSALGVLLMRVASETAPFEIRVRGIGAFPSLKRPNVIWAGLEGDSLAQLATQVETAAFEAGFEREQRKWTSHLTLGRVRDQSRARSTIRAAAAMRDRDFGACIADRMAIYQSRLQASGSIYEMLHSFEFGAAGNR